MLFELRVFEFLHVELVCLPTTEVCRSIDGTVKISHRHNNTFWCRTDSEETKMSIKRHMALIGLPYMEGNQCGK